MESLYDDVMMEHIKNVRNYRELEVPTNIAKRNKSSLRRSIQCFFKVR